MTNIATPKQQLDSFIAKFTPDMAKQIRFAHTAMKKRWPTAQQLVYDNYNFLVIAFSPTERPSDAIFSIAADANGVTLFFAQGAKLPGALDPHQLLKGSGTTFRSIKLVPVERINDSAVAALMQAANAHAKVPMPAIGKSVLTIRAVSAKQRPRRKD